MDQILTEAQHIWNGNTNISDENLYFVKLITKDINTCPDILMELLEYEKEALDLGRIFINDSREIMHEKYITFRVFPSSIYDDSEEYILLYFGITPITDINILKEKIKNLQDNFLEINEFIFKQLKFDYDNTIDFMMIDFVRLCYQLLLKYINSINREGNEEGNEEGNAWDRNEEDNEEENGEEEEENFTYYNQFNSDSDSEDIDNEI